MKRAFEYLTEGELVKVLAQAKKESIRDWCLILVTYKHALRSAETAELMLDDLRDGCLDIRRKKHSLHTIQPLFPHKGNRCWMRSKPWRLGSRCDLMMAVGRCSSVRKAGHCPVSRCTGFSRAWLNALASPRGSDSFTS